MIFKKQIVSLLIVFLINFSLIAQDIRINEVVSSNSEYFDEDGDTPDWIELHNFGASPISLLNWGLTDDSEKLHDWQFPDITINPDEYLLVWASNKDITKIAYARTLVNQGDVYDYLVPNTEPDANWRNINFDATDWNSGASGFGFGDGDDATTIQTGSKTVFMRITFTMADVANLTNLILDVDYDDGFIAFINGVEIARANVNGSPPAFDATSITDHEAKMYKGETPDRFIINNPESVLIDGENVLAIQVHNVSSSSSDLTLIPFLTAKFSNMSTLGVNPPEILSLSTNKLHTNFRISSSSEELFLSDENQNIVDQILVEGLKPNTSYGISATTNDTVYFTDTTPGEANSNTEYLGVLTEDINFSDEGGLITESSINLALSGKKGTQEIRYTLDATEPSKTSTLYTTPITIATNTVVRAQLFDANYIPSFSKSKTYVFNSNHEIDVIFLATAPDNFFNNDTGIYVYGDSASSEAPYRGANFWEDWERPIHFSFYNKDAKKIEVEFNAGVKIFGNYSRASDQRSLSIFARGQYGKSEIDYPFFDTVDYNKFQSVILRNSGNDWLNTSIRDAMLTSLMSGSGIDVQAFNPVATYLNGEYWGMYNLREKINEHFLASKHNLDAGDINLLEKNGEIIEGSNTEYKALMAYVASTDLSIDANFDYIKERIDLENYAVYQIAQIYFNNKDWPGNNIKFWNHNKGKWRWILFDTDFGFAPWDTNSYNSNTLSFALETGNDAWPNPDWSTLLFRSLLKNSSFRNQFINRYADELNSRFLPQNVSNHINAVYELVKSEIPAQYARWKGNVTDVQNGLNRMKIFGNNRGAVAKRHIKSQFNLPNFHQITIKNTDNSKGLVQINNNLNIQENNWNGDYFENVPIILSAIAKEGFTFSHWSGASNSKEKTIELNLNRSTTITPNFVTSTIKNIVINEINYKSGDVVDAGDWVELYNPNNTDIDISNWILKDSNDDNIFNLPSETILKANSYLVLIRNEADFNLALPAVTNYIGEFDFGLGGNDAVRLYNENEVLQDEVSYNSDLEWAACADGKGPSLELISPDLDNNLSTSWDCTNEYGTPDAINSSNLSVDDFESEIFTIHPNPVGNSKSIFIKGNNITKVELYSALGKKILELNINNKKMIALDIHKLNSGIYILNVNDKNRSKLIIK